jgi:hypothetical protein
VWRTAALHLSEAENVVVIGYSVPDSDEFFRYFYALGSVGESVLNVFAVVDPDGGAADRFRLLLGLGARDRFHHVPHRFQESLGKIRELLGIP